MARITSDDSWIDPAVSFTHEQAYEAIQRLINNGPTRRFPNLRPAMHVPPEHDDADRILANVIHERDRLREARDILWDRAHDRGVAIEHARNRLLALAGHHDTELLAIADALWASMQDAIPADARGEKGGA